MEESLLANVHLCSFYIVTIRVRVAKDRTLSYTRTYSKVNSFNS